MIFPAPMSSRQYGTVGKNASRQTSIEEGRPGRFTIRERPRIPAVWRERIAVGTCSRLTLRMSSPKPGNSFVITRRIASGVRSRGEGPAVSDAVRRSVEIRREVPEDIAEMTGTALHTISRLLSASKKAWLTSGRQQVTIVAPHLD